jgi:hypothetical protein
VTLLPWRWDVLVIGVHRQSGGKREREGEREREIGREREEEEEGLI